MAWDGNRPVGMSVSFLRDGRAYRKLGFVETGRTRPYPHDPPGRLELEMTRPL